MSEDVEFEAGEGSMRDPIPMADFKAFMADDDWWKGANILEIEILLHERFSNTYRTLGSRERVSSLPDAGSVTFYDKDGGEVRKALPGGGTYVNSLLGFYRQWEDRNTKTIMIEVDVLTAPALVKFLQSNKLEFTYV